MKYLRRYWRYLLPLGLVGIGSTFLVSGVYNLLDLYRFRSYWDLEVVLPRGASEKDILADIYSAYGSTDFPRVTVLPREKTDLQTICGPGGCRTITFTEGNLWVSISPMPNEDTKEKIRTILAHYGTTIVAENAGFWSFKNWAFLLLLFFISYILFHSAWDLFKHYRERARKPWFFKTPKRRIVKGQSSKSTPSS
ncbi:MAG: hypothetical protein ACPLRP_06905 [Candidatus Bipolaricaulaceae bacterium]